MEIKDRIKKVRGETKQKEFAESLGISLSAVQSWEYQGNIPGGDALTKIHEIYGININWLLTGEGGEKAISPGEDGAETEFDMVPMARAKLSAGGGNIVLSEGFKEYYAFRKEWVSRVATSKNNVFLMAVEGDSMEPTIYDGDTAMIDQGRQEIRTGRIYALGTGDLIMIKRLDVLMDARVKVISDNAKYSPYIIDGKTLRVIGQVVWFARQLVKFE